MSRSESGSSSVRSVRLPDVLWERIGRLAVGEGLSVNGWVVRALGDAVGLGEVLLRQREREEEERRREG